MCDTCLQSADTVFAQGIEHEEDQEENGLYLEILSNIRTPRVSEIRDRLALLVWSPPLCSEPGDPRFDALRQGLAMKNRPKKTDPKKPTLKNPPKKPTQKPTQENPPKKPTQKKPTQKNPT
jgi:hypothetical protein